MNGASRCAAKNAVFAWLLAGTLDITAAVLYYPLASGITVLRLFQGIASGLLGARAFTGGLETAALGLMLHYLIALIWTLVLFIVFRTFEAPGRHLLLTGIAYGVFVWLAMNLIVLPLSNVRHAPFHLVQAVVGTVILIVCIGLPIAFIIGRQVRKERVRSCEGAPLSHRRLTTH